MTTAKNIDTYLGKVIIVTQTDYSKKLYWTLATCTNSYCHSLFLCLLLIVLILKMIHIKVLTKSSHTQQTMNSFCGFNVVLTDIDCFLMNSKALITVGSKWSQFNVIVISEKSKGFGTFRIPDKEALHNFPRGGWISPPSPWR